MVKSFCYAVIGYKTAWLSLHYPAEFAVANCTINNDSEDITATLALARKRKIPIMPPDINKSGMGFTVDNGGIRYGLQAVKMLGASAIEYIQRYRELSHGYKFKDFDDYYVKTHDKDNPIVAKILDEMRQKSGKNTLVPLKKGIDIALILSGAFDFCEPNRYKLLNHYMDIRKIKKSKIMDDEVQFPLDEKSYKRRDKLAMEKFYMGTYISEHPLDPFPYEDIDNADDGEVVKIAGIVEEAKIKKTRRGSDFISLKMKTRDEQSRTVNIFKDSIVNNVKDEIKKGRIIIVVGGVSKTYNNITATKVKPVSFKKQTVVIDDSSTIEKPKEPEKFVNISDGVEPMDPF